jgi:hypothetical protein
MSSKHGSPVPISFIHDSMSAAELARTKPFPYKTVLMVALYHSQAGQLKLTKDVFQYLSAHMIVD